MIATAQQSTANWDVSDSVKLGYLERERVCRERKTEKEEGEGEWDSLMGKQGKDSLSFCPMKDRERKDSRKRKGQKRKVVCYGAVADTGGCGTSW